MEHVTCERCQGTVEKDQALVRTITIAPPIYGYSHPDCTDPWTGEVRTTSSTGGSKSWRKPRPTHTVDPVSLAWVAGIVEGEGSFYLRQPNTYPSPIFQVSMCDLDVIERAAGIMRVGNIKVKKPGPRSVKDQYQWRVSPQAEVAWVMDTLYPLMGERRRAKIDELRPFVAPWARGGTA